MAIVVLGTPIGSALAQSHSQGVVSPRLLAELVLPGQKEADSGYNPGVTETPSPAQNARQWLEQKDSESSWVAEEEESILLPGRSSAPPSQRARARGYLQEGNQGLPRPSEPFNVQPFEESSTKENAQRNQSKARKYLQNQDGEPVNTGKFVQIGTTRGVVGKDGVIEMVCDGVNNHAGHIGDDTRSGNLFTIMISGKPAKARCK
jgi:hypothetical protein